MSLKIDPNSTNKSKGKIYWIFVGNKSGRSSRKVYKKLVPTYDEQNHDDSSIIFSNIEDEIKESISRIKQKYGAQRNAKGLKTLKVSVLIYILGGEFKSTNWLRKQNSE